MSKLRKTGNVTCAGAWGVGRAAAADSGHLHRKSDSEKMNMGKNEQLVAEEQKQHAKEVPRGKKGK